jgi:EmrB/QacA subfamily drug resistance transporter
MEGQAKPLEKRQILIIFSGLVLVMLLAALDSTIVATALPTIVRELGGLAHLSWVVTAYLLAQTVVTPLYGKLGDQYGRKKVLQVGVVLFLIGSALCGLSRNLTQLIIFRAIQGFGGGGLTVTTQAVVGDIVSPRERGRYQGIFGAVFGLASIAGPLLGGFFTSNLSWRWIFYINLPLGVVALAVIAVALPAITARVKHKVDYAGALLLAVALSATILLTDVGGSAYAWTSWQMLSLLGLVIVAFGGFIFAEGRAPEPVVPLRLFRNRAIWVTSAIGLIIGFALFGSVTYLPLFLQVVKHASPTASGLLMLPMMAGMLVTSIGSGQLISRTGRYKIFPVIGTGVMAAGLFFLSRMTVDTSLVIAAAIMAVLGFGLGMVMQVLVVAAQNAVDYADLGVATSGATLFRLVGGSLGTAALGAIFAARLSSILAAAPSQTPAIYAQAYTTSLSGIFLIAAVVGLVAWVLSWMLPETPLRETVAARAGDMGDEVGEAFGLPTDGESFTQLLRGVSLLADRDFRRRHLEQILSRAGVALTPAAGWMLLRINADPSENAGSVAREYRLDAARLEEGTRELESGGLIVRGQPMTLTPQGCAVVDRIIVARRERLAEMFSEWPKDRHEEIASILSKLARELVPDRA